MPAHAHAPLATAAPEGLRIGVLTFHRCINYGSYWQTRCLLEGLLARGHRVWVLDHDCPRINRMEWRCALQPVAPMSTPAADRRLYARKTRAFFDAIAALPSSRRFPLDHPEAMDAFDAVVIGSDEVWNLTHPWYGQKPLFFGHGLKAPRVVAYAASFGHYPAARGLPQPWAGMLDGFHRLSVRDSNASTLVTAATGRQPALVLDPCLQFMPRPTTDPRSGAPARFAAVYGHNFSAAFAAQVRAWADRRGMRLVSIGYRNDWCDTQWLAAGPGDFERLMTRTSAVATNFFHGCVFALRNQKPFMCEDSAYRSIKIRDLLSLLGAQRHMTASPGQAECDALLSEPLSTDIEQVLGVMRSASDAFLDDALPASPAARGPCLKVA